MKNVRPHEVDARTNPWAKFTFNMINGSDTWCMSMSDNRVMPLTWTKGLQGSVAEPTIIGVLTRLSL